MPKRPRRPHERPPEGPLDELRSAMADLQSDAERQLSKVRTPRRRKRTAPESESGPLGRWIAGARQFGRRAGQRWEEQAGRLTDSVEKEVSRRLEVVLRRLDLPSRTEVAELIRRIEELEQKLQHTTTHRT